MPEIPRKITIATRESPLALWQAHHIRDKVIAQHPTCSVDLLGMTTKGDQILEASLSKVGGKGLFVKELELALMDGRADIAVHSGKDVPMSLPEGMQLQVVDQRADPRDALVLPAGQEESKSLPTINNASDLLGFLPHGAVVGTSSMRRQCQLIAIRPDLKIKNLRGNLNTRLRKLDEGEYDAIVLAVAGLERLGFHDRITAAFSPSVLLPAVAQGALAIEFASAQATQMQALLAAMIDVETCLRVSCERAFNQRLNGSCQTPLAGHAELIGDTSQPCFLQMQGLVGAVDGSEMIKAKEQMSIDVSAYLQPGSLISSESGFSAALAESEKLGVSVAQRLLDQGADRLLALAEHA